MARKKSETSRSPRTQALSPREALMRLQDGNRRFVVNRRAGNAPAQNDASWWLVKPEGPFAIILSCSDSRAPSEILFDQGLGDLFVIRVAGNIVAPSQVGSVEFAAATTQAKLVVVMGHTECGAVRATLDALDGKKSVSAQNIEAIVSRIRPHIEPLVVSPRPAKSKRSKAMGPSGLGDAELWRASVRANVRASTDHLRHGSQFLEDLVSRNKLAIVGAEYCLETGVVDFFDYPVNLKNLKSVRRTS